MYPEVSGSTGGVKGRFWPWEASRRLEGWGKGEGMSSAVSGKWWMGTQQPAAGSSTGSSPGSSSGFEVPNRSGSRGREASPLQSDGWFGTAASCLQSAYLHPEARGLLEFSSKGS